MKLQRREGKGREGKGREEKGREVFKFILVHRHGSAVGCLQMFCLSVDSPAVR
jgi:hypothetical protein